MFASISPVLIRFAVRYFVGYCHMLAQGASHRPSASSLSPVECQDGGSSGMPDANIPYFGLALVGWF